MMVPLSAVCIDWKEWRATKASAGQDITKDVCEECPLHVSMRSEDPLCNSGFSVSLEVLCKSDGGDRGQCARCLPSPYTYTRNCVRRVVKSRKRPLCDG
ncbi:hypothetical protein DdX_01990 [Ditylenchus destructor]|uniref:Uncharacterized protein n=1 Tax=Ditylenchus destructor TaxID=166010 RepID=A0AAD4NA75_9BILA|nr:hypothetical protein DdX_01990 [Ditylenchus destructor]